eukprot:4958316-Prorocentrum_lima.AAC.1
MTSSLVGSEMCIRDSCDSLMHGLSSSSFTCQDARPRLGMHRVLHLHGPDELQEEKGGWQEPIAQ